MLLQTQIIHKVKKLKTSEEHVRQASLHTLLILTICEAVGGNPQKHNCLDKCLHLRIR